MAGLFSKPEAVKPPAPKDIAPPPVVDKTVEDIARRRRRAARGRRQTFITGDLAPDTQEGDKKRLLG